MVAEDLRQTKSAVKAGFRHRIHTFGLTQQSPKRMSQRIQNTYRRDLINKKKTTNRKGLRGSTERHTIEWTTGSPTGMRLHGLIMTCHRRIRSKMLTKLAKERYLSQYLVVTNSRST